MIVYLSLLVLLLALAAVPKKYTGCRQWGFAIMVAVLVLVAGLRSYTGTDFGSYRDHYCALLQISEPWAEFELLYEMVSRLFGTVLNMPRELFFTLISALTVVPVAVTIQRESRDPEMSLFLYVALYFYFTTFNLMRQCLAVSVLVAAYPWLRDRKCLRYMLAVLVASGFHTSALVMIPVYFLAPIRLSWKLQLPILALGALVAIFGDQLIAALVNLFPKYAIYADIGGSSAWMDVAVLLMALFLLNLNGPNPGRERQHTVLVNMAVLAILVALLASCNLLFARIHAYFYIYTILSLPESATALQGKTRKFVKVGIYLMALVVCLRYLRGNISEVIPYHVTRLF